MRLPIDLTQASDTKLDDAYAWLQNQYQATGDPVKQARIMRVAKRVIAEQAHRALAPSYT